jgi:hypothetical protein
VPSKTRPQPSPSYAQDLARLELDRAHARGAALAGALVQEAAVEHEPLAVRLRVVRVLGHHAEALHPRARAQALPAEEARHAEQGEAEPEQERAPGLRTRRARLLARRRARAGGEGAPG